MLHPQWCQQPERTRIPITGQGVYSLQYDDEKVVLGCRDHTVKVSLVKGLVGESAFVTLGSERMGVLLHGQYTVFVLQMFL